MDKILVEIKCIATGKSYDFILPGQMKVKTAKRKIIQEIMDFENNDFLFPDEKTCILVDLDQREILNETFTLEQAGVYGGNCLILV